MLAMLVDLLREEYDIAATVQSGAELLERALETTPDLILLDVTMGDMSGLDVAARLRKLGVTSRILYLSLHEGEEFVEAAFAVGASAYVFKSQLHSDLVKAIRAVVRGETFRPALAAGH